MSCRGVHGVMSLGILGGGLTPPGWCCCCEGVNPPRLDAVVLLRPLATRWQKRPHFAPPLRGTAAAAGGYPPPRYCCCEGG